MKNQLVCKYFSVFIIFLIFGFLIYFSCSKEDDDNITNGVTTATINGTLNIPTDATGKSWAVLVDNDINGENGNVCFSDGTCGTGTAISYTVENVPTGTYYLYAVVFVVSDGSQGPQPGDYWGIYGGQLPNNVSDSPNANITSGSHTFDINLTIR